MQRRLSFGGPIDSGISNVKEGLADYLELQLSMQLIPLVDHVHYFHISNMKRYYNIENGEKQLVKVIYFFSTSVTKNGQSRLITLPVSVTSMLITYPAQLWADQLGIWVALTHKDIGEYLFKNAMEKNNSEEYQYLQYDQLMY